jgi:hypothetical protein
MAINTEALCIVGNMALFIKELKAGMDAALHPTQGTRKQMPASEALKMYYKFSVIPALLFIIFGSVLLAGLSSLLVHMPVIGPLLAALSGLAVILVVIAAVMYFWIFVPIGIIISAAIWQLFGKFLLKKFNKGYSATLTAAVYGALPSVGLLWTIAIPVLGILILFITSIWGLILGIYALANQQNTSKRNVLLVYIVAAVVVGVLEILLIHLA